MTSNKSKRKFISVITTVLLFFTIFFQGTAFAEDRVELDTTLIKGNKELPKILYVVPWKEIDGKAQEQQKLRLHSLFGDLFDPSLPLPPEAEATAPDSNN